MTARGRTGWSCAPRPGSPAPPESVLRSRRAEAGLALPLGEVRAAGAGVCCFRVAAGEARAGWRPWAREQPSHHAGRVMLPSRRRTPYTCPLLRSRALPAPHAPNTRRAKSRPTLPVAPSRLHRRRDRKSGGTCPRQAPPACPQLSPRTPPPPPPLLWAGASASAASLPIHGRLAYR